MIEFLFPKNELVTVSPPRMDIGDFIVFRALDEGYNPFGVGQQAVHNSTQHVGGASLISSGATTAIDDFATLFPDPIF